MKHRHVIAIILSLGSGVALAQDRAIERTPLVGNRELPKVLYIVPWKKPRPGELSGKPIHSVLDELLEPIDRDALRRQLSHQPPHAPATAR